MNEVFGMFESFVSLGQNCPVAASMSKYGLRSWAGPFDWLITFDFKWILHFMENDFEDFLPRKHLKHLDGNESNGWQFMDEQSGFIFLHDYEYAFEGEYDKLKQKYQRRIDRFLTEIRKPVCFLRFVATRDEIDYIINNWGYINNIIRKGNSESEIVFIVNYGLQFPIDTSIKNYIIPKEIHADNPPTRNQLRSLFDELHGFLVWCAQNYDACSIMENIIFDRDKERMHRQWQENQFKICKIDSMRYHTLTKLLNCNIDRICLPNEIVIYGAGNIGRVFKQKIEGKCMIRYFIDKEKKGQVIDGILVKGVEDEVGDDMTFVVTATYDFDSIRKVIESRCSEATIISLDDILDKNQT